MSYRKSIFAAVLSLPLVLAACGSDDEADKAATSSKTTSSASSSTQAKPDDAKKKEEEEAAKKKAEEEEAAKKAQEDEAAKKKAEEDAAAAAAAAPAEGGEAPAASAAGVPAVGGGINQPVEGGKPANDADRQAITNLISGLSGGTVLDYMNYSIDNACTSFLEANGGAAAMRQSASVLAAAPEFAAVNGRSPQMTVNDVQVNGERASAAVSAAYGAETASENIPLARENGKWKLCPTNR